MVANSAHTLSQKSHNFGDNCFRKSFLMVFKPSFIASALSRTSAHLFGGGEGTRVISAADIRHIAKLANVPNDVQVTLRLGKEFTASAYSNQVRGREFISRGKIPGTEIAMPPVRFFSQSQFALLERAMEKHLLGSEPPALKARRRLAWFDPSVNATEVVVPGTTADDLPPEVPLQARLAKRLIGTIVHESMHGAGKGEFMAFRAQHDAELRMGLRQNPVSNVAIMRRIEKLYPEYEVVAALEEFEQYCRSVGKEEEVRAYWLAAELRISRELHELGEIEVERYDSALFEREVPIKK